METDRNLRSFPINSGSKVGESLVNSIDGSPRVSLSVNTSTEGTNPIKIVEEISIQTQARIEKNLIDQPRFVREKAVELVTEHSRLQKLIIENDLLKHLFKTKMKYSSRNKSQNWLSSVSDGREISGAIGNGGNGQARPKWTEKSVTRDVSMVNSQGARIQPSTSSDHLGNPMLGARVLKVRNKDARYKGIQSLTQNAQLILDGQSEQ
ncbi:unnamed protein product [Ilex paraguariensis]|uniref:Uncharacterized protein n=1 Tax=Ilex paraguariensis TaxID=185542 RepID=A0ABC8UKM8_9AQUA